MKRAFILLIFIGLTAQAWGHASYIGYSGAPGSRGTCSLSCHHRRNFAPTITVTGFPSSYMPGQQYTIAVAHQSGTTIKQFNASVRVGTGSENGGVIEAGTNTVTYTHVSETNGVHFSTSDRDSGTFLWTAPASGTGEVRLYWAGLQGNLSSGADTAKVLVSAETPTGIEETPGMPQKFILSQNYPNPFNSETVIQFNLSEPGQVDFAIANILGQTIYSRQQTVSTPGTVAIHWDGRSDAGVDLPSGLYFYRLSTAQGSLTRKMILLR